MDHNGAFAADDSADVVRRVEQDPSHIGEDAILVAEGGIRTRPASSDTDKRTERTEETPLLGSTTDSPGANEHSIPAWPGASEWDHIVWYRRPSAFWLLGPFVFSAIAFGGIIIPKINLILSLVCREYFADEAYRRDPNSTFSHPINLFQGPDPACRTPEVQEKVSGFLLQGTLISGILAAIIAPKLGALSDRYGRKPIMGITNAGMLSGEILTILAATYPDTFPVKWMLLGYFFDGLCGSFIASMSLAHSYATDCTSPERRNVVFGYFHGALFSGIALGPLIAGWLIEATGKPIIMFYVALACHLFFILFLIFIIPESLSKARQFAAREKHKRDMDDSGGSQRSLLGRKLRSYNIFEPLKILYPTGPGSSAAVRRNLLLLGAIDTIIFGVAMGAMSIVVLYSGYMFGWGDVESSIFMSVVNTSRVFCLLVVLPAVTRLYRGRPGRRNSRPAGSGTDTFDLSILRVGIFFDMLGFLGYTLSGQGWAFMLSGAVAAVGGIGSPTLQAALTKHVPPDRVGQLLGAMGLLHALARVIAPVVFNVIYIKTVKNFPQTCFVVLTVLFSVAALLSWGVRPGVMLQEEEGSDDRRQRNYTDDDDREDEAEIAL